MPESKCSGCQQRISLDDSVQFDGHRVAHLDCRRPRDLSHEERALLFRYCWSHAVAKCAACAQSYRQDELGADLLGNRTHLCSHCRADLTERVRAHVYACALLPEELRLRVQDARAAAQRLVKQSSQLHDHADVLMREAEAAVAALRKTMARASGV